jgi:hypothetical protein
MCVSFSTQAPLSVSIPLRGLRRTSTYRLTFQERAEQSTTASGNHPYYKDASSTHFASYKPGCPLPSEALDRVPKN